MACPFDERQLAQAANLVEGGDIQRDHRRVVGADDQERRRFDELQGLAGEIGAATAADHGLDHRPSAGGGPQRGGGASAGAEETNGQVARF
jgi:hypothetical protein